MKDIGRCFCSRVILPLAFSFVVLLAFGFVLVAWPVPRSQSSLGDQITKVLPPLVFAGVPDGDA